MKKDFCDRCGAEITTGARCSTIEQALNYIVKAIAKIVGKEPLQLQRGETRLELCEGCSCSLQAWFDEGSKATAVFNIKATQKWAEELKKAQKVTAAQPAETEVWNGYHGQVTAPKGTFEAIWNDCKEDDDGEDI